MKNTRFQIAKNDIIEFFNALPRCTFLSSDIYNILADNRKFWRLPVSLSTPKFIDLLVEHTPLKYHTLDFPNRRILEYTWGDVSVYRLAVSMIENSYLSHYSSVFLHNLTEQIPKTVYVTFEQLRKRIKKIKLLQKNVDYAFSKPARVSHNIAIFGEYKICLLNGAFANKLGVIEFETSEKQKVFITDIERTLIDITVRSVYAGGIYEVLKVYKNAKDKVSINKLTAMFKKLNFIYPYHQAIGFYLEKAGVYRESQVNLLQKFDFDCDFYLSYQMKEMDYSKKWRLYYPKGF